MASQDSTSAIIEAFAKLGVDVEEAHQAELVKLVENIADPDLKGVMDAIAQNLVLHGIAGAFQGAARNDVTNSEAAIIDILNSNVVGGVAAFDSWLRKVAGEAPRTT